MNRDRTAICAIISQMLDNPDEQGIYPTTRTFDELEALVHDERISALGWASAYFCTMLDAGKDLRQDVVPDMLSQALIDLGRE